MTDISRSGSKKMSFQLTWILQIREKKSSSGIVGAETVSSPGRLDLWSSILVPCIFISCSKNESSGKLSLSVAATDKRCSISGCLARVIPGRTAQGALCSLSLLDCAPAINSREKETLIVVSTDNKLQAWFTTLYLRIMRKISYIWLWSI